MSTIISNIYLYSDLNNLYSIIIDNGKISSIKLMQESHELQDSNNIIVDGQKLVAFPGMIDVHTHMRDLNLSHKEDYLTGSKACLHGGITSFFDMPNTNPPTFTLENYENKIKIASQKSLIDFGFHFGASKDDNCEQIQKTRQKHILPSLKIYLNPTTGGLFIEDDSLLEKIFLSAPSRIMVHTEGVVLIQKVFNLAKKYQKNIYFCHIALKEEINLLLKLKEEIKTQNYSFQIAIEVTPHHLYFNEEDLNTPLKEKILIMKPTLKTKKDQQAIMQAFIQNKIDAIGTDHAPHLLKEKLEATHFGVPGVESALPLLLDLASKKIISYEMIVQVFSSNPCQFFKIKNKGNLKPSFDADIVLVDLNDTTLLNENNIQSKCSFSIFDDVPLKGKIKQTWLRGNKLYDSQNETYYQNNLGQEVCLEY